MKQRNMAMPPRPPQNEATPLMIINEISKLFRLTIKQNELPDSPMSQDSFRLILIFLNHNDGITQLRLSELTHFKPPTISIALGKMEALGYVRREVDKNDQRAIRVFLTEKGKRMHDERLSQIKVIDSKATENISEAEICSLMTTLFKIRDNFISMNHLENFSEDKNNQQ